MKKFACLGRWTFRLVIAFSLILTISGCASNKPTISGEFGDVEAPNNSQVAELLLKSGNVLLARKLQQEDDSVFAQNLDFSISSIPTDSIVSIKIRGKAALENEETKAEGLTEEQKSVMAEAGVHAALWLVVAIPLLIVGWLVSRAVDTVGG